MMYKHRFIQTNWGTNFSLLLTLLTAFALLLSNPATEAAKMYYTWQVLPGHISRANLDGTDVEDLTTVFLQDPYGIAVDAVGEKMYWADASARKIQRANLDGTDVEDVITGLGQPWGLALDVSGGKIYWTDFGTHKIQRANLDGTNIEDLVTTGLSTPRGIALDADGGKMYWTDIGTDKIQRANLDGTNVEDLVTTGLITPEGIAVDAFAGKIYWTDGDTHKIQRANLDGTNVEDLVTTGLSRPHGITVDPGGRKMYWMNRGNKKIQRANLDGTNIEDLVIGPVSLAYIALDFSTSAATVTLVDENPPFTWNYRLTHNSGAIEQWTYTGKTITSASVDDEAEAAGWSVQSQTDTQVVFATTTALTSGTLTRFHITGTGGGTGTWIAGSNSGGVDGPLPVELAYFSGTMDQDGIHLRWRTESETNNLGFDIYRSDAKDGKYTKVNARLIQGAGTDATPHDYSFSDENVIPGKTYYYYIEDVDFSGETNKSHIIEVTVGKQSIKTYPIPLRFMLLQNYPNPFNPETWLPYELAKGATVTIRIYDVKGQLVRQLDLGVQKAGRYLEKKKAAYWDGKDQTGKAVSSGLYFYTLKADDFQATRRMLIVK